MSEPTEFKDATGQPFHGMPDVVRAACGAVIFNESGEVLLEERSDNGFWGMPGGAVDAGESVREAVIREVLEETGLHVEVKRLVGIYSDPRRHSIARYVERAVQHVVMAFECRRQSGKLRFSEESTDLAYFDSKALPAKMLPAHRVCVNDALAGRCEAFIR